MRTRARFPAASVAIALAAGAATLLLGCSRTDLAPAATTPTAMEATAPASPSSATNTAPATVATRTPAPTASAAHASDTDRGSASTAAAAPTGTRTPAPASPVAGSADRRPTAAEEPPTTLAPLAAPPGASPVVIAPGSRTTGGSGFVTSDHSDDEDSPSSGPVVLPRAPDKNEVLYTWQDGDRTRHAWLQTDLALQPSSENTSEDAVVSRGAAESIVERRAEHTQGSTEPVFRSESGSLMTLPGGVILVLERDWAEAHVDQFFSDHGIAQDRVVEQHFVPNAYLIETEPGLAALTLANALADQEGVIISSPNWRSELVLN